MAKKSKVKDGTKVVETLLNVLSDTYVLMVKTHGYHWNVTGSLFPQMHEQFGKQYDALFEAADELAERIRALGESAPNSMASMLANSVVREASGQKLSATAMLKDLIKSHEAVCARILECADVADDADDIVTEDLMVGRLEWHEKTLWMLRAQVE